MKKILLTGGTGFLGTNILNQLSKKFKFTILIRNKKKIINKNVRKLYFKNLNHLNKLLWKGFFGSVFRCAAFYWKVRGAVALFKLIVANILLGIVVLGNSKLQNFKKFVNLTSVGKIMRS
jgi:NAD dependent epimerase/dehydratase family.